MAMSYRRRASLGDSLAALERSPWMFLIKIVWYLLLGTGMLLALVVQLAIFAPLLLLDARGNLSGI